MTVLRTSLRNFLAHKGRMALSAMAVLLSVAFVCGTLVFTDTMTTTFDKMFAETSADTTVSNKDAKPGEESPATGTPETVPASLVERVRGVEGVKSAQGVVANPGVTVVDADNDNVGSTTGAPTIAGNWTDTDRRTMEITSGNAPRGPTEVMVDADTAEEHGLKLGDELRTITADGDFTAEISGIAAFQVTNPGAAVVYFDTATAQRELLGDRGAFTQVTAEAESGFTHELLKRNIAFELGPEAYTYQTQQEAAEAGGEEIGGFLDVIRYALLGFAGIALIVGVFLIVNTFSMLVAQRTREIGLMRAVGASRRQVGRGVLTEALLLGVVGSVLGVGAGVGLAVGLMELMGAAGVRLSTDDLTVAWSTPVVGLALGVLVTLFAAYLPARRAGKVSPMAAMRDANTPASRRAGWLRAVLGTVLTAGGAGCLLAATEADDSGSGGVLLAAGVPLTLVGAVVVGPVLAAVLVRALSLVVARPFGRIGRLAERNALRNPKRTGATGSALMIGLSLVASLAVVGSSMVASLSDELERSVGADFIVEAGAGKGIGPQVEREIRAQDGLAAVTALRTVDAEVTPPNGRAAKSQLAVTESSYTEVLRRETVEGDLSAAYGRDAMSVGDEYAEQHGVSVGDTLEVAFAKGRTAELEVAAITSDDTAVDKGAMYTGVGTAQRYLPRERMPLNDVVFAKAEEGQQEAAYAALKSALEPYPQMEVKDQADYKESLEEQIGQLLNMVYGLLALAIVVAILGVVNTLALSVVERTREIGMMRAIGLSRRQMRRMIRLESVVIALFGAVLGLALGLSWGVAAQRLLALEGLRSLDVPWPTIGTVFAGAAVVGLAAALVPAFRAGRMNVLRAIATE